MKKLQFYNQKFELQFYVHDQMTINLLKQLIFERVGGGLENHQTILNRDLPQQQILARGEELGQPHKKPYQRWYRLLLPELLQGKTVRFPSLSTVKSWS
jgi:hypothetical protein